MRPECAGTKDDESDRCDLYDSEGWCRFYGDTWKDDDGVCRGGEEVELITYCTHRTINGKRINDSMNPLYMERLPRYFETVFDGEIRSGITVWGDGTMHDPVSKKTIYPDGTVIENDDWGGNRSARECFEVSIKHMKGCVEKISNKKQEPRSRRVMESATVDKEHHCWGWHEKYNNVCHLCRFSEKCCAERRKREKK